MAHPTDLPFPPLSGPITPAASPFPPAAGTAPAGTPGMAGAPATRTKPPRLAMRKLVAPVTLDPIRVSLAALMMVSISRVHEIIPLLSLFRPGLSLTALCLGLAILAPKTVRGKNLTQSWTMRRMMWFYGFVLLLAPVGVGPSATVTFMLEVLLPTVVFAGLVTVAIRDVGDMRLIVGAYVASLAIVIYQAYFVWEFQTFNGFQRLSSQGMYDANDLGAIFAGGMPLAVLLAQTSGKWGKLLGWTVAIGTPATVAMTGSRGGFLGLGFCLLALVLSIPRISAFRRVLMILLPVGAMALAAPEGYMKKMGTIFNPEDDYNMTDETGRIAIWKHGLSTLAGRPLTGVGASNFVRSQWATPRQTATGSPVRAMSSHNSFVQVGVETGVPLFLVWFSVVFGGIVGLIGLRRRLPHSWLRESPRRRFIYLSTCYLPVAFIGWSVGSFFVSHGYHVPYYILGALVGATWLLLKREADESGLTLRQLTARKGRRGAAGSPAPRARPPR